MSDTETTYEVNPDLFDDASVGEGGAYWPKKEGTYKLQLLRFERGPEFENDKDVTVDGVKTKVKVKAATVRWAFGVYRLNSGKRVTYEPAEGEKAGQTLDAEADGLTSRAFSKGSKAGKWLRCLLGREIDFEGMANMSGAEQSAMKAALMQEALGKWATGTFGLSKTGKVTLTELGMMDSDDED